MRLFLDIEGRSPVDLRRTGVYVYAESPHTEIVMVSWALDEDDIQTWYPHFGEALPDLLFAALCDPTVILVAHNASFERVMFSLVGPRILPPECVKAMRPVSRWNCTAARAAAMGLPRTLEGVGKALRLNVQKDVEGHRLMMKLCRPRGLDDDGVYFYHEDPADIRREGRYCETDVHVERQIDRFLPDLSPIEQRTWEMTEGINDRGLTVDTKLLVAMTLFVADAELDVNRRISEATNGGVPKVSNHAKLRAWLVQQGLESVEDSGIGKAIVNEILASEELDPLIREVIIMRQEGGKSSAAKFKAVMARLNRDGKLRGSIVYCGAQATGRFASRGAQVQNLSRGGTIKNILDAIDDVIQGITLDEVRAKYGPPLVVASEMIRPTFVAEPDCWLARGDLAQIEMRVNAWLSGQANIVKAFEDYDAGRGPDLYRIAAALIYHLPVDQIPKDDPRRQVGKVSSLALCFAGGVGAFQAMARIYNVKVPDAEAEGIKVAWREANKATVDYWRRLDDAAKACVRGPVGVKHTVRPDLWFKRTNTAMALRLPSGRSLVYWYPRVEETQKPWGKTESVTFSYEDPIKKIWTRADGYGGFFCQNATQAVARDIMAHMLLGLNDAGLRPVLTVHDEGVCQASKAVYPTAPEAAEAVRVIMSVAPDWARGLPIAVDVSAGARYVKA